VDLEKLAGIATQVVLPIGTISFAITPEPQNNPDR
jgi:hypothetical protein